MPTYLYEGHCYNRCPTNTYTIVYQAPEIIAIKNTSEINLHSNNLIDDNQLTNRSRLSCGKCNKSCFKCFGPLNLECLACYPGSQLRKVLNSSTNESYCYSFAERSSGNNNVSNDNFLFTKTNSFWLFFKISNSAKSKATISIIFIIALSVIFYGIWLRRSSTKKRKNANRFTRMSYAYDRVHLMMSDQWEIEAEEEKVENTDDGKSCENSNETST